MEQAKELRFITGMHRSGTTWLGQAIDACYPGSVVHEPFNAEAGLEGIDGWYLGTENAELIQQSTAALLNGRARFRRVRSGDGTLKRFARRMIGSPADRNLARALASPHSAIVLKDPFVIRVGQILCENFSAKGVILVRHPAALINSLLRMGWPVPTLSPEGWRQGYSDPATQFAYELGQFWGALYSEVESQLAASAGCLVVVRHEDLCRAPIKVGKRVFDHLQLEWKDATERFLSETTSGDTGEATGAQLHQMRRSGKELAFAWKRSLSPEMADAVCAGAGNVLDEYYPDNW